MRRSRRGPNTAFCACYSRVFPVVEVGSIKFDIHAQKAIAVAIIVLVVAAPPHSEIRS